MARRYKAATYSGHDLPVADTPVGRVGLLVGDEIWVPEAARVLAVRGAEVICHPCSWDRPEAATKGWPLIWEFFGRTLGILVYRRLRGLPDLRLYVPNDLSDVFRRGEESRS